MKSMDLKYNKRILVIDDDKNISEMLRDGLELRDYEVEVANSGKEGLRKAIDFNPDIITLDLEMPRMSGFEVLNELKKDNRTKDITVFILSVRDDKKSLKKGFLLGAKEYIVKPFSLAALGEIIEEDYRGSNSCGSMTLQ